MSPTTRYATAAATLALLFASAGCASRPEPLALSGLSMGTAWRATLVAGQAYSSERSVELRELVQAELDAIEDAMSTWRPETELSRFNRAEPGAGVELGQATWEVLDVARWAHGVSGGAFDPTVGPLVEAWGFGGAEFLGAPDEAMLAALERVVGLEHLVERRPVLDKDARGVEVDLSAVAKGYAVDRVCAALQGAGVPNFLVEVGGEVRCRGERPGGGAWRVAIEDPRTPDERRVALVVEIKDGALATSGDYRNVRVVDGVAVPHLFDPRTLRPIATRVASASVLADTCARADAIATALTVLGPEEALALAGRTPGIEVLVFAREPDGTLVRHATPGFERQLVEIAPSSE